MKKTIINGLVFLVVGMIFRSSSLPIFISYSFWEEWGDDFSRGGYEWGLMNFKEALIFTPNLWVDVANWVLLAVYSVLLTLILLKMVQFSKRLIVRCRR
ncbi:MAG: hypothetical protein WC882_01620 [Candidatus Gracilibacteria bacterium]